MDGLRHAPNHVAGVGALHHLTVQTRLNVQPNRAGWQFIGGDQDGAECARFVKVLTNRPLGRFLLVVTHRNIIETAVPKHAIQGVV